MTLDNLATDPLLQRSSLKDQAVARLRAHIIAGEIAPGTQLVERDVAELLGVSRAPTREALLELESQGLLVNVRGRRRVIEPSAIELAQMFEVRAPLEQRAACRAAEHASDVHRQQLAGCLERMAQAVDARDRPAFVTADLQLHREIWRQSGNGYLEKVLNDMSGPIFLAIVNGSFQGFDWNETFDLHRRLVESINAGDVEAAALVAGSNMKNAVERNAEISA